MLTEKDVLIAACGKDRDGYSKSAVKIDDAMIDVNTGEEEVNNELLLDNAVVNIFRNSQMTRNILKKNRQIPPATREITFTSTSSCKQAKM